MRRHRFLALAGLLVMFWAGSPPADGAAPKKPGPEKEVPLHITAARLEADQIKGIVIFTGSGEGRVRRRHPVLRSVAGLL